MNERERAGSEPCPHGLYVWEACTACLRKARDEAVKDRDFAQQGYTTMLHSFERLKAERDLAAGLLYEVEWVEDRDWFFCPICCRSKFIEEGGRAAGHSPDCRMAKALEVLRGT